MIIEGTITIPTADFVELVEQSKELSAIKDTLFGEATLSYDGKDLYLGNVKLRTLMKAFYPDAYEYRLKELQEAKKPDEE